MSLILSLETSTRVTSVALHEAGNLLACHELFVDKSHAAVLTRLIDAAMTHAKRDWAALDAVAVAGGPGSYTGLRIGVTTAKGLCFALERPLLAIDTLAAMAAGVAEYNPDGAWLVPMLDARRQEVYTAVCRPDGSVEKPSHPHVLAKDSFRETLDAHPMWFFGDGAAKSKAFFGQHPHARFLPNVMPSARHVGPLATEAFRRGSFADVSYFEPFYLKPFQGAKR